MVILNNDAAFLTLQNTDRSVYFILKSGGKQLIYTLPLNPTSMTVEDPFLMSAEPGLDGRLTIQRGGVVARKLVLTGTMGLAIKTGNKGSDDFAGNPVADPTKASFNWRLDSVSSLSAGYSGVAHFQFLQDRIIRAYGDLVRDPKTAGTTTLEFYNPLDEQYWVVEPVSFHEIRSDRMRNLQTYQLSMLAVDRVAGTIGVSKSGYVPPIRNTQNAVDTAKAVAQSAETVRVPDKGVSTLEQLRRAFQQAINQLQNANLLNDIPGLTDFINTVRDVAGLISDVGHFVGAAINLVVKAVTEIVSIVNGIVQAVASGIASPFRAISNLINGTEDGINSVSDNFQLAMDTVADSIDSVGVAAERANSCRMAAYTLGVSVDRLVLSLKLKNQASNDLQAGVALRSANLIAAGRSPDAGEGATISDNLSLVNRTGFLAGERDQYASPQDDPVPLFRSIKRVLIRPGATLEWIAQTEMGDAKFARILAFVNNLKFPFITDYGLPYTKKAGDVIDVPSPDEPRTGGQDGVVGIVPGVSAKGLERLYGRDVKLERFDDSLFGWQVRADGMDVDNSVGLDAYTEALEFTLGVESGSYPQAPEVGIPRFVGSPSSQDVITRAVLGIRQAVEADPRTAQVSKIQVQVRGDQLTTSMTLVPIQDAQAFQFEAAIR